MVGRQPKDLTCCQEWGFVLHLAPDSLCHLPLVSCTSRCLAPHPSRGYHECLLRLLQKLGSVVQLAECPGEGAAFAGAGWHMLSSLFQIVWNGWHGVTSIREGTDGGLKQWKSFWPLRGLCGKKATEEVLLLGTIYVVALLVLWGLMPVKDTLTFEWNLLVWICVFCPLFSPLKENSK